MEQLFIYMGDPKFTGINNHVNELIYRDLGLTGDKNKSMRKKIKEILKSEPLGVMERVYHKTRMSKEDE